MHIAGFCSTDSSSGREKVFDFRGATYVCTYQSRHHHDNKQPTGTQQQPYSYITHLVVVHANPNKKAWGTSLRRVLDRSRGGAVLAECWPRVYVHQYLVSLNVQE